MCERAYMPAQKIRLLPTRCKPGKRSLDRHDAHLPKLGDRLIWSPAYHFSTIPWVLSPDQSSIEYEYRSTRKAL